MTSFGWGSPIRHSNIKEASRHKQFNYTQDRSFFPCCSEVPLYTTPRISLLHWSYYINLHNYQLPLYCGKYPPDWQRAGSPVSLSILGALCFSPLSLYYTWASIYKLITQQLNNTKLRCRHTVSHTTNKVIQKGYHCLLIVCGVLYNYNH